MTATATDPRPQLAASLDQLQAHIDTLNADDLGLPTPCDDFDVRTLLAHLLAVLRKLEVVSRAGDFAAVKDPAEDTPTDWAQTLRTARADFDLAWSDDALLDRDCRLPWGVMTGREVLDAYTHEFTVHAWDLARVKGSPAELDPRLSELALDWFQRYVPAEGRGEGGPFAPAVEVAADADIHTRLVAYVGRKP